MFVVLPQIHGFHAIFFLNAILGSYLLFSIVSNLLATILVDSSVFAEDVTPPKDVQISMNAKNSSEWRLCISCGFIVPPRSYHCQACNCCILKRDHHCIFAGNCIGFHNHRYFVIFLFFLFISTFYASIYNIYFIFVFHYDEFCNFTTIFKLIFPMFMILIDASTLQYYLFISLINIVGALFSGALFFYHMNLIMVGKSTSEKSPEFDLGVKENLKIVFGDNMLLTFLCPFVVSKIQHNGVTWTKIDKPKSK